jgi:hypothetical protein
MGSGRHLASAFSIGYYSSEKLMRNQMLISPIRRVGKDRACYDLELFSNLQKTPDLSANTLDNRPNCRHIHMLDRACQSERFGRKC